MTDGNQMKIEKRNKNNKFRVALGTIVIAGAIGVTAYSINKNYKENNFTRIVTEDGNYELDGFISYDKLKKYSVVEIETITGERKMYIAIKRQYVKATIGHPNVKNKYCDIYSDKIIGTDILIDGEYTSIDDEDTVISATNINDFLIAYDMIKGKYSEDDIEYLLNRIKDDYQNNENLKLVKTKSE